MMKHIYGPDHRRVRIFFEHINVDLVTRIAYLDADDKIILHIGVANGLDSFEIIVP